MPAEHFEQCFVATKVNPVNGVNWWLVGNRAPGETKVQIDTVGALGMYNQKPYVIPSKKLVIVRFGKSPSRKRFRDAQFLQRLFGTANTELGPGGKDSLRTGSRKKAMNSPGPRNSESTIRPTDPCA